MKILFSKIYTPKDNSKTSNCKKLVLHPDFGLKADIQYRVMLMDNGVIQIMPEELFLQNIKKFIK